MKRPRPFAVFLIVAVAVALADIIIAVSGYTGTFGGYLVSSATWACFGALVGRGVVQYTNRKAAK